MHRASRSSRSAATPGPVLCHAPSGALRGAGCSRGLGWALALALLGSARAAAADVKDWEAGYVPPRSERRSDFAGGLHLGGALGSIVGYPNEAAKVGVPEYEQGVHLAPGAGGALWVGASLRDFFTFGVSLAALELRRHDRVARVGGVGLHVEAFPLFYQGGVFRDLGVMLDVGLATGGVERPGRSPADGGALSCVGAGVLYEPLRFGRGLSFGPFVQYLRSDSLTMTGNVVSVGLRTSFYGGPG